MKTAWVLIAGAAALLLYKKSGITPGGSKKMLVRAYPGALASLVDRFQSLNKPIGNYTRAASGVSLPDYDRLSLTLGIKRDFAWEDTIPAIPTTIDHSEAKQVAVKASRPWAWSDTKTISYTRRMPFGAVVAAIAMHESGGDPYQANQNTNGSVDFGLCQINNKTLSDPSNWPQTFGKKAKAQGLYLLYHPVVNLEAASELLQFLDQEKGRTLADLLVRYAGWNQFLVSPHQTWLETCTLIAAANDLYKT